MFYLHRALGPYNEAQQRFSVNRSPEVLIKPDSEPVGLGWGLRFCFSNMLPGTAARGPRWRIKREQATPAAGAKTQAQVIQLLRLPLEPAAG